MTLGSQQVHFPVLSSPVVPFNPPRSRSFSPLSRPWKARLLSEPQYSPSLLRPVAGHLQFLFWAEELLTALTSLALPRLVL